MTNKTWTATDLELGALTMGRDGNMLNVQRRYYFLDADGKIMPEIAMGRLVLDVPLSNVPSEILSALQAIDSWTKQKALSQEGMGG